MFLPGYEQIAIADWSIIVQYLCCKLGKPETGSTVYSICTCVVSLFCIWLWACAVFWVSLFCNRCWLSTHQRVTFPKGRNKDTVHVDLSDAENRASGFPSLQHKYAIYWSNMGFSISWCSRWNANGHELSTLMMWLKQLLINHGPYTDVLLNRFNLFWLIPLNGLLQIHEILFTI
jgi:hypothetical protein